MVSRSVCEGLESLSVLISQLGPSLPRLHRGRDIQILVYNVAKFTEIHVQNNNYVYIRAIKVVHNFSTNIIITWSCKIRLFNFKESQPFPRGIVDENSVFRNGVPESGILDGTHCLLRADVQVHTLHDTTEGSPEAERERDVLHAPVWGRERGGEGEGEGEGREREREGERERERGGGGRGEGEERERERERERGGRGRGEGEGRERERGGRGEGEGEGEGRERGGRVELFRALIQGITVENVD